jgi:hypothetical protein
VAQQLSTAKNLHLFQDLCGRSDGAIATTPDLAPLFLSGGTPRVEFIPTPYPVNDSRWDFRRPEEEKRGVLIGTRETFVPSRNHLAALLLIKRLAEGLGEPVTVFHFDGWRGRRILRKLGYADGLLKVIEHRLPYTKWLRAVAKHRFVFQLDASTVPGQIAGDALLARVPCVGGCGTTERLVFPDLCGWGRNHEQLFDIAARLFEHPHDCAEYVQEAERLAGTTLSFSASSGGLEELLRAAAQVSTAFEAQPPRGSRGRLSTVLKLLSQQIITLLTIVWINGVVVRMTVRDSSDLLAPVYYATPWPVLAVLTLIF